MSPSRPPRKVSAESRRSVVLAAVLVLASLLVIGRLIQIQGVEHDHWAATAQSIQEQTIEVMPRRGTIYDRNGVPLAFDVKATAIAIDSYDMTRPESLVAILSKELGQSPAELRKLVYRRSYFTWIDRAVDLETAKRIKKEAADSDANGLIFIDTWKRCYPQGSLASNLIGFVGTDGHGLEGIELEFNKTLSGTPTTLRVLRGADGRTYETQTLKQGTPGDDVYLTIDSRLQFICEQAISQGVATYRANQGFVVLLDPNTGQVLAMAQDQRYDLNEFWKSTPAQRRDLPISFLFEPGSTFKAFGGLDALYSGVITPQSKLNGNDGIRVGGHTIHNSENESFGTVTFAKTIQNSINCAMVQVAQRLGAQSLHDFLASLGFGKPTGIQLPGEEKGILRPAREWTPLDLAESSIGQSVGVTGIQLARAMAAVANGGSVLEPRIVQGVGPSGQTPKPPAVIRRVASPATCTTMRGLMRLVVERGTATPANIPGFDVAGKTGTAQKAIPGKGYVPGKYTSLFCGFFPQATPTYLALVVLDEVKTTPVFGGNTAGQIFHDMMSRVINIEQVAPVAQK
jgi:stage V sporulation protein D (sporulation-specific penicillin-binding protein)